jgi:hypothetical protein
MLEELCSRHVVSAPANGRANARHDFLIRRGSISPSRSHPSNSQPAKILSLDRLGVESVLTRDLWLSFSARARSPDTPVLEPMSAPRRNPSKLKVAEWGGKPIGGDVNSELEAQV